MPRGPAPASAFQYDEAGRMTSRTDAAGTSTFAWTDRGELDTAGDPLTGETVDYTWNDASQVSAASCPVSTFSDTLCFA